jgi:alcohol dehydrogenase class IV
VVELNMTAQHTFFSPNKIIIGLGAAANLAAEVQRLGAKKALIVTDPGVVGAGMIETAAAALDRESIAHVVYDKVQPDPSAKVIDAGAQMFRSEGCDLVLGLGGGSSLDAAKGIGLLTANPGSIMDYCGVDRASRKGAALILMPTTSGTGSEATRVLMVSDPGDNTKLAVFSPFSLADVALVDPELTKSMPPAVTADTGVDALVHAIETYVSTNATIFSDVLAERAIERIAQYLPIAWAKGTNIEARFQLSAAATLAGMAFGSGGLGAVHAFAHALGTVNHLPHGRANAVMLPHVMKYNLAGNPEKFAAIAELMGVDTDGLTLMEAAEQSVNAVKELLATMEVSCHLSDYQLPMEGIPELIEGAMRQSRLFIPNPRDLTEADVKAIYEAAY